MAQRKNAGSVVIKLDLRGQEELKRRLEELGPTGERVWRDLRRGAKPAEQGFKAVDAARQQLQGGVDELASRAGPLGQFLTSIGPWGLAAAAGLGVLALALREVFVLMERSRETAFWAEELENAAAAAGMMEDRVLSLGSAVQLAGGDFNAALAGLEEFSKRIGEYRATGQGEGRDAFDALGLRDLVDSGADATTVLDAVLERMREIQDPARRLAIADKLGLREAAPLLQRSADDMERILGAAENINAAFSEQVLQDFANAGEAIREAQLRQDRARQLQSLATVDLEVSRQQALARMEEARTAVGWNRVALEERSTEILEMQRDVMLRTIERVSSAPAQYAELGIHVADLRLELEQLNVALEEQAAAAKAEGKKEVMRVNLKKVRAKIINTAKLLELYEHAKDERTHLAQRVGVLEECERTLGHEREQHRRAATQAKHLERRLAQRDAQLAQAQGVVAGLRRELESPASARSPTWRARGGCAR